ncbi:hypothetical protein [Saccharopolyspora karakumensis]|uniref:hypothetical protein n=1 Tax=Saccharopolyspora karakumensis TaxID=2530386 RepID=UPI002E2668BA
MNGIERPQWTSVAAAPEATAARIIGRIGVIPMPPAMNRYSGAGISGKVLRGRERASVRPSRRWSWTYSEPPRLNRSRRTAIR